MTAWLGGLVATFGACLLLYLASPHQALRSSPLPAWPARCSALSLAVTGLGCLLGGMHTLAAVFCFATLLMVFLVALPYAGAQRQRMKSRDGARR